MPRSTGKISILVVLAAALLPAAPAAASARPVAGRNFVGGKIDASIDPYRQLELLSTKVVDHGRSLNVWLLSAPRGCGGDWDIASGKLPIDSQGHFHGFLPFGHPGAQTGLAGVDGSFVPTRHGDVAAHTTIRARLTSPKTCGTGTFRMKAISPKRGGPHGGRPAPNAVFVGITKQNSARIRVKLPMLALLDSTGTQVKRFVTDTSMPCKPSGRYESGLFRIKDMAIKDDKFDGVTGDVRPVEGSTDKRTLVLGVHGTFGQRSVQGTWQARDVQTNTEGTVTDDCDAGTVPWVAARVR